MNISEPHINAETGPTLNSSSFVLAPSIANNAIISKGINTTGPGQVNGTS